MRDLNLRVSHPLRIGCPASRFSPQGSIADRRAPQDALHLGALWRLSAGCCQLSFQAPLPVDLSFNPGLPCQLLGTA